MIDLVQPKLPDQKDFQRDLKKYHSNFINLYVDYLNFISKTNDLGRFNVIPIEVLQFKQKSEEIFVLHEELINLKLNYYYMSFGSDNFYTDYIIMYTSFLDTKDGIIISES
jgi:hypothetical protein